MKFSTSLIVRLIPLFLLCAGPAGAGGAGNSPRPSGRTHGNPGAANGAERPAAAGTDSREPGAGRAASRQRLERAGRSGLGQRHRAFHRRAAGLGRLAARRLTLDPSWQQHATFFDEAWAKLAARQFTGIREWEVNYLPDATQPLPVVFYMFSGPDFLYAHQFFPNASTYILAGTEPIGPLPDVLRFGGPALAPVLQNLQKSLNSVLSFSFFITKDMKNDLQSEQLKGTLPIFYVFLARAGKTITDISFITLDKSGQPHPASPNEKSKSLTPGVRITFTSGPGARPRRSIISRPIFPMMASAASPGS